MAVSGCLAIRYLLKGAPWVPDRNPLGLMAYVLDAPRTVRLMPLGRLMVDRLRACPDV